MARIKYYDQMKKSWEYADSSIVIGGNGDVTKKYVDEQDTKLQDQINTKIGSVTSNDGSVTISKSGDAVDLKVIGGGVTKQYVDQQDTELQKEITQNKNALKNKANKNEIPTKTGQLTNNSNFVVGANITHIKKLKQSEYDGLSKDANTLYIIVG